MVRIALFRLPAQFFLLLPLCKVLLVVIGQTSEFSRASTRPAYAVLIALISVKSHQ
jgi:hypothetical protein